LGGLGLGTAFNSILAHLTTAATPRYAADLSGVFTTCTQIAGSIGVAAFGTLYLSQDSRPGELSASHAFGMVTGAFALMALVAAVTAYRAVRHKSTVTIPGPPRSGSQMSAAVSSAGTAGE